MELVRGFAIVFALLAGPFFYWRWYRRWLATNRHRDGFSKVPPLLLAGSLFLAMTVQYLVFRWAEVAGYHVSDRGWLHPNPVQVPDYVGEGWPVYFALAGPVVALLAVLLLPKESWLIQVRHLLLLLPAYAVIGAIFGFSVVLFSRDSDDKPVYREGETLPAIGSRALLE